MDRMTLIMLSAALVVAVALLVWLSLSMASAEGAVGRVTRANHLQCAFRRAYCSSRWHMGCLLVD